MIFWLLIAFSAVTAFIFRTVPFVFRDSEVLNNQEGSVYRFLKYTTQAMMGVIVYDTAFDKAGAWTLIDMLRWADMQKFLFLLATFLVVAKTKKMLPTLVSSLLLYLLAVACENGGL